MTNSRPTVVIVGRPNTGKSTLFNRIIGSRVAVVEDTPGVTRDRLYGETTWNGVKFTVVDTGGILFNDEDPLVEQIRVQAEVALAEADLILFLCDAADGLLPADIDLANRLRPEADKVLVVVNKADNPNRDFDGSEFYALGLGGVFNISSLHGRNVADLLDEIVKMLPGDEEGKEDEPEVRLAIIGRPNVGKSSLLNAFTGEQRAIVSDIPGTTRDMVDTMIEFEGERVRLIDTAGLRRKGKIQGSIEYYMAMRSKQALERSECALVVIDGAEGLTDGDKRIAKMSYDSGKACVLAINKWDLVEPPDGRTNKPNSAPKADFLDQLRGELPEISYAPAVFLSAQEGQGLERVLQAAFHALENYNLRISTGHLNRVFQDAMFTRPYTSKGRPFKLYYSTQTGARPPTFSLFVNNPELLHFSYRRYLENQLRKSFPLEGTPIRFNVKSSHKREGEP